MSLDEHERWMREALSLAEGAANAGEVPVGALVIRDGERIAMAANDPVGTCDPTAHAEVRAIRAAATALDTHRLDGCTLYVTLEPCLMCCGAILTARIETLVYGAREPRTGAVVSAFETLMPAGRDQHRVAIVEGVLADACAATLQRFFTGLRSKDR